MGRLDPFPKRMRFTGCCTSRKMCGIHSSWGRCTLESNVISRSQKTREDIISQIGIQKYWDAHEGISVDDQPLLHNIVEEIKRQLQVMDVQPDIDTMEVGSPWAAGKASAELRRLMGFDVAWETLYTVLLDLDLTSLRPKFRRSETDLNTNYTVVDQVDAGVFDNVLPIFSMRELVRDAIAQIARAQQEALDIINVNLRESVWDCIYGQHDSHWLAFYDFFRLACHMKDEVSPLLGHMKVAQNAGWWLPCREVCFISERPNRLELDAERRLHSTTGPALQFPDGFGVYVVHGVRVPAQVVEAPETLDPSSILKERNAEVQRVMLSMFGEAKFINAVAAQPIAADRFGAIFRIHFPESRDEDLWKVRVTDPSTGRVYWLGFDPNAYHRDTRKYPQAAVASTWRYGPDNVLVFEHWQDYEPEVET